MKKTVLNIIIASVFLIGCSSPELPIKTATSPSFRTASIKKIAIYFNPGLHRKHAGNWRLRTIEDEFVKTLLTYGYSVPSRADVDILLKELKFQNDSLTEEQAAELGKMINTDAILIINLSLERKQNSHKISARLIDVETSEVLWIGELEGSSHMWFTAEKLSNKFPSLNNAKKPQRAQCATSLNLVPLDIDKIALILKPNSMMESNQVEDNILFDLMKKGYRVPSRSDMDNIFRELKSQYSLFSDEQAVEVGRILNVPAILLTSVNTKQYYSFKYYDYKTKRNHLISTTIVGLGCRLIDVESSEILWISTIYGTGKDNLELKNKILKLSDKITNCFPIKN